MMFEASDNRCRARCAIVAERVVLRSVCVGSWSQITTYKGGAFQKELAQFDRVEAMEGLCMEVINTLCACALLGVLAALVRAIVIRGPPWLSKQLDFQMSLSTKTLSELLSDLEMSSKNEVRQAIVVNRNQQKKITSMIRDEILRRFADDCPACLGVGGDENWRCVECGGSGTRVHR